MKLLTDHRWLCRICLAEGLIGRRAQAVVAAGVLAMTSVVPPAALAQQAVEDPAVSIDFDPGGDEGELPQEATEAPEPEPVSDAVAAEPVTIAEPGSGGEAPVAEAPESAADVPEAPDPDPDPELQAPVPDGAPPAPPAPRPGGEPEPAGTSPSRPPAATGA